MGEVSPAVLAHLFYDLAKSEASFLGLLRLWQLHDPGCPNFDEGKLQPVTEELQRLFRDCFRRKRSAKRLPGFIWALPLGGLVDLLGLCGDPRDLVPHHARSQQKGDGTPSAGPGMALGTQLQLGQGRNSTCSNAAGCIVALGHGRPGEGGAGGQRISKVAEVLLCPRDVAPDDHFADLLASLHCSHQLMGQPEARTPHAADLLGMTYSWWAREDFCWEPLLRILLAVALSVVFALMTVTTLEPRVHGWVSTLKPRIPLMEARLHLELSRA
ncbi:unnamed protein product [Durusdinium trenchii]|uniref:Uncharacterized protein n=1 Tax=Durusdinium trenchii TaxID=1381693 RepID=A0ABP0NAD1_9DINO